jgi:threonine dehydratase
METSTSHRPALLVGGLIGIGDVEHAARKIGPAIIRTPFLLSQTLSDLTGAEIWLKFEYPQFTASFKERGALNRLMWWIRCGSARTCLVSH